MLPATFFKKSLNPASFFKASGVLAAGSVAVFQGGLVVLLATGAAAGKFLGITVVVPALAAGKVKFEGAGTGEVIDLKLEDAGEGEVILLNGVDGHERRSWRK